MPRAHLFDGVRTVREDPANLGSADAELFVAAEDSMDYVVKTIKRHPGIPASEWVCHHLADSCGIATPQFAQVQLTDGRIGFGSQWDASAVADPAARNRVATAIPGAKELATQFSAIYALDIFVHNVDRHLGNYFFVSKRSAIGVKAYDFSRALFYHGWKMPNLPLPGCSTVNCYRSLRVGYPYDAKVGASTIQSLRKLKSTQIADWLDEMPAEWMQASHKLQFVQWWQNDSEERLKSIDEGLKNGTYL